MKTTQSSVESSNGIGVVAWKWKACTCCGALFTREQYLALPAPRRGGVRVDEWVREEFRDCTCGGTMVVVVEIFKDLDAE